MRAYTIFTVLVVMVVAWALHFVFRPQPEQIAVELGEPTHRGVDGASPEVAREAEDDRAASAPQAVTVGDGGNGEVVGQPLSLDRPIRVTAASWELLAPGINANDGRLTTEGSGVFADRGLRVELEVAESDIEVERALALGGELELGADVAIMSLPVLAASFEMLSPLHPEIFFVSGWSSGGHALRARVDSEPLPVALEETVVVVAEPASTAYFLALFVLELTGIEPARVRRVDPGTEAAAAANLFAVGPGSQDGEALREVLSTTQATRLIPYVALASREVLEEHREAFESFALAWMDAARRTAERVPETARLLGTMEGAPEALELLGPLSGLEPVDLLDNARVVGLAGHDRVPLSELYAMSRRLWFDAGVITGVMRGQPPIAQEVIAGIVRRGLMEGAGGRTGIGDGEELGAAADWAVDVAASEGEREQVLELQLSALGTGEEERIARLALIAGVFEPLTMEIRRGLGATWLGEAARVLLGRYGWTQERIVVTTGGVGASIVLTSPVDSFGGGERLQWLGQPSEEPLLVESGDEEELPADVDAPAVGDEGQD